MYMYIYFLVFTVNMQQDEFQPKPIATVRGQTSTAGTKSPQVAVIPPLVDLTKVTTDDTEEDEKSKG